MNPQRRRQSRHIWVAFIILASIGVATTAMSWIINLFYGVQMAPEWWVGFFGNLSTEVFGAILTVWFLEMFIMEPARRRHRLSDDVKASDGVTARRALDELKRLHWIDELKGQDLRNVQWAGANLSNTDLAGTDFTNANLAGINLTSANLTRCRFQNANLESAVLERANLEDADLSNAYLNHALLENTTLTSASLKGASLENASLIGAKLALAQLDGASFRGAILTGVTGLAAAAGGLSNTILPDGEVYTPGKVDLDRYTDSSRGDAIGPTTT